MKRLKTIRQTAQLLTQSKTTASHLLETCLNIANANEHNAFVTVTSEYAVRAAEASNARAASTLKLNLRRLSPLDGIPIAVKDNFCMPCCSQMIS